MTHLFIDTNRYLLLYGFKKEDLEGIKKIVELIKRGEITLWLPQQVINEFNRNRDKILLEKCKQIKRAIKAINDYKNKIPRFPEIPEFQKELNEINESFEEINKIGEKINAKLESIIELIKSNLKKESFLADKIIKELFSAAKILKYDEEVINKAKTRFDLDIPPGKEGSYGDAVIWETLLKEFPKGEDLYFVGFDNDFRSNIDNNEFSPFLIKEWKERKKSEIIPFKHLGEFIKSKIPDIEQSDKIIEEEKRLDKNYLITAPAFSEVMKEIYKSTSPWKEAIQSLNVNIAHALASFDVSQELIRQQAELVKQYTETISKAFENTKFTSSAFGNFLKIYEQLREPIAKEGIKKAEKENKEKEKTKERKKHKKG